MISTIAADHPSQLSKWTQIIPGVEITSYISFENWEPQGEYVKNIIIKNVSKKTQQFIYEAPNLRVFSMPFPKSVSLGPGISCTFLLTFRPLQKQKYQDQIQFKSSLGDFSIPVYAKLPEHRLKIPNVIDFGFCPITISNKRSFKLINNGQRTTQFEWMSHSPFTLTPNSGEIKPAESIQITVEFKARKAGVYECKAILKYGDDTKTKMPLSLKAISKFGYISVNEKKIQLPDVYVGHSSEKVFRIQNPGLVPVHFQLKRETKKIDENDSTFIVNPKSGIIEPGQQVTMTIQFKPQLPNVKVIELFKLTTDCAQQTVLEFSGQCLGPKISLASNTINFGDVLIGQTKTKIVTLNNNGDDQVRYEFHVSDSSPFHFERTKGVLLPNTSIKITVKFTPTEVIHYFKRVSCFIENQEVFGLDLLATCCSPDLKPPSFQPVHLERFQKRMKYALNLYAPDQLEEMLNKGEIESVGGFLKPKLINQIEEEKNNETEAVSNTLKLVKNGPNPSKEIYLSTSILDFGSTASNGEVVEKIVKIINETKSQVVAICYMNSDRFELKEKRFEIAAGCSVEITCFFKPSGKSEKKFWRHSFDILVYFPSMLDYRAVREDTFVPPWSLSLNLLALQTKEILKPEPKIEQSAIETDIKETIINELTISNEQVSERLPSAESKTANIVPIEQPKVKFENVYLSAGKTKNTLNFYGCKMGSQVFRVVRLVNEEQESVKFDFIIEEQHKPPTAPSPHQPPKTPTASSGSGSIAPLAVPSQTKQSRSAGRNSSIQNIGTKKNSMSVIHNDSTIPIPPPLPPLNPTTDTNKCFQVYPTWGIIEPKSFKLLVFVYKPSEIGLQKAKMNIKLNDSDSCSISIDCTGRGCEPVIEISEATGHLKFPPTAIGVEAFKMFFIRNIAFIDSYISIEPHPSEKQEEAFDILPKKVVIQARASFEFKVKFKPNQQKEFISTFIIMASDTVDGFPKFTQELTISGNGLNPVVQIDQKLVDLKNVTINSLNLIDLKIYNPTLTNFPLSFEVQANSGPRSDLKQLVKCQLLDTPILYSKTSQRLRLSALADREGPAAWEVYANLPTQPQNRLFTCKVQSNGALGKLRICDAQLKGMSKAELWKRFSIGKMNQLLSSLEVPKDALVYLHYPWQTLGSAPIELELCFENPGLIPAEWYIVMPSEKGATLQMEEEKFLDTFDRQIFSISQKSGIIEPGKTFQLKITQKHSVHGVHELLLLFCLKQGTDMPPKQIFMYIFGQTWDTKEKPQMRPKKIVLESVPVGLVDYPIQYFSFNNPGQEKIKYEIEPNGSLLENFEFVSQPKGTIEPGGVLVFKWKFIPKEIKTYRQPLYVYLNGNKQEFELEASGIDKWQEVKYDHPGAQLINFQKCELYFSRDLFSFGTIPCGSVHRNFTFINNPTKDKIYFKFQQTAEVEWTPSEGFIEAGDSVQVVFLFKASYQPEFLTRSLLFQYSQSEKALNAPQRVLQLQKETSLTRFPNQYFKLPPIPTSDEVKTMKLNVTAILFNQEDFVKFKSLSDYHFYQIPCQLITKEELHQFSVEDQMFVRDILCQLLKESVMALEKKFDNEEHSVNEPPINLKENDEELLKDQNEQKDLIETAMNDFIMESMVNFLKK